VSIVAALLKMLSYGRDMLGIAVLSRRRRREGWQDDDGTITSADARKDQVFGWQELPAATCMRYSGSRAHALKGNERPPRFCACN
jgi:hypothetical protein